MCRRYRVAHLITRLDLGGAQQNTLFCVEHHDRARFEVELVAGRGGLLDDEARRIADAHVRIVPFLRHPVDPLRDVATLARLRSYLKRRRVDLVHTHSSKAGLLGRVAAFLAGVPAVVHTVHGWSFNETQARWQYRAFVELERAAARLTHRLIVVSNGDRERGLQLGIGRPDQYRVVHSGIDMEAFRHPTTGRAATRERLGVRPDEVLVGTVACLKPQKAPGDFVRAAAAARAHDRRLRFILAGDGPLRGEVESLARELGVGDVLRVLGWRRDVADLLHAMDIFLLTSRFEGLPRSVLQAMAAGVPVVATAVDGTPEVVRHRDTGLLVAPGRPDQAAAAVCELAADATLGRRCARAATRLLDHRFDIHRMVRDLEGIYLSLLEAA
jgi:glycosyltransferase involved in cell wall biosynthesis